MESSSHIQQIQWSCSSSESEFYSISSPDTISPDQRFSPSCQIQPVCTKSAKITSVSKKKRRMRLKNPSEQRQNASEKEKLRMRDLTKALHHLRSFLPPSVAPVGQTLTKIETLRLTIRYISFLSAQLGLSEEELSLRKPHLDSDIMGYFQCRSVGGGTVEAARGHAHCEGQNEGSSGHTGQYVDRYSGYPQQYSTEQHISGNVDGFLQSQQCTHTYQVYGRNFGYHLVPQTYWS